MEQLIQLLISIVIFAIVGYGLWWVCAKFGMPQPVLWICGAILLIGILIWFAHLIGVSSGGSLLPRR